MFKMFIHVSSKILSELKSLTNVRGTWMYNLREHIAVLPVTKKKVKPEKSSIPMICNFTTIHYPQIINGLTK